MKIFNTLFLLYFFTACSQNNKEVSIIFTPQGTMTYQYDMRSEKLNMIGTFDADFIQKNNLIEMNVEIISMSATTSDNEDLGYNEFVGSTFTRIYNTYGMPADLDNIPKQVINTDLFIVEFPKLPMKEGLKWKAKKTAKPDMFFDTINVEYTCTLIKDDIIIVKANMNYETKDKFSSEMKMTRKYNGDYIINVKDGSVKNARLYMHMFSGFSQISGILEIRKL